MKQIIFSFFLKNLSNNHKYAAEKKVKAFFELSYKGALVLSFNPLSANPTQTRIV